MRIYIMGQVGVGKSHAVDHLEELGYHVSKDPVIQLGETLLAEADPLQAQVAVACTLYLESVKQSSFITGQPYVIMDSCLPQSFMFAIANKNMGFYNTDQFVGLSALYNSLQASLGDTSNNDVYIYLHKPEEVVKDQIRSRGRAYEQDNPFIQESNRVVRSQLCSYATHRGRAVHVIDVSEGYDKLIETIDEIIK